MRLVTRRRAASAIVALFVILAAYFVARPFVHGLTFVIRAAEMQGTLRRIADLDTVAEREREITIPLARGPMRARVYEPVGPARRAALLVSGLHPSGIDEPRLMRLARDLAADDLVIVTPDIPELSRFEITPAITATIEETAAWLASASGLAPDHRVGLMGISFSGGLSIVAAGRPSLRDRVAYVFSLGGHDDLPRVLRYLCTGQEPYPAHQVRLKADATPDATTDRGVRLQSDQSFHADQPFTRPPHDYGVAVIVLGVAERLVPRAQVEPLRAAVRRYLWASALDGGVDKGKAAAEFESVRALIPTLPQPSATILRHVVDRDVVHLGPRLLPYIRFYGSDAALSPSKSPKPPVPVFLLHGTDDNVIPSIESEYLADDLRGHAPVRLLLSGLISHADADRPARVGDVTALASFWGDLLSR
jgi:dienelactone hydrolase